MDPNNLFADERLHGLCVYCGNEPEDRDHAPSKVLLDRPFPENLPVVEACRTCNHSFSLDEQYLACLLDCVICGSANPDQVKREIIGRILRENRSLAARIAASQSTNLFGDLYWHPEASRVRNVMLKLARGHAAYEFSNPHIKNPDSVSYGWLGAMPEAAREEFEAVPLENMWPEIGSRGFLRLSRGAGWQNVQEGRYRYLASQGYKTSIRIVLSEYLACEVVWNSS